MIKTWFRQWKYDKRVRAYLRELHSRQVTAKPHGLDAPLIVSLTSFPPRYAQLANTLRCLLRQSVAADQVILWIAHDDIAAVPQDVLELKAEGLCIRTCDDLRSFKKIIPALAEDPNRYIVTADDDVYYGTGWLEALVAEVKRYKFDVIAHRAHHVRHNEDGTLQSYENWTHNLSSPCDGPDIFATGVGGVLYPPHALSAATTDVETFLRVCPSADDVWLYWMARLAGSCIRKIGSKSRIVEWPGSQKSSLLGINRGAPLENGNDKAIAAMTTEFGLPARHD